MSWSRSKKLRWATLQRWQEEKDMLCTYAAVHLRNLQEHGRLRKRAPAGSAAQSTVCLAVLRKAPCVGQCCAKHGVSGSAARSTVCLAVLRKTLCLAVLRKTRCVWQCCAKHGVSGSAAQSTVCLAVLRKAPCVGHAAPCTLPTCLATRCVEVEVKVRRRWSCSCEVIQCEEVHPKACQSRSSGAKAVALRLTSDGRDEGPRLKSTTYALPYFTTVPLLGAIHPVLLALQFWPGVLFGPPLPHCLHASGTPLTNIIASTLSHTTLHASSVLCQKYTCAFARMPLDLQGSAGEDVVIYSKAKVRVHGPLAQAGSSSRKLVWCCSSSKALQAGSWRFKQ